MTISPCPLVVNALKASCGTHFAHGVVSAWCVRPKGHSGPHQGPCVMPAHMLALLKHVPHNNMTATHRMVESVAGCPGCEARAILRDVEG